MSFTILWHPKVAKYVEKLPKNVVERILDKIDAVAHDPFTYLEHCQLRPATAGQYAENYCFLSCLRIARQRPAACFPSETKESSEIADFRCSLRSGRSQWTPVIPPLAVPWSRE